MATPPSFTAGSVLTAAQMNAVGLWLVKTQAVGTAVSSQNVTGCFSSDFTNYFVTYDNIQASANGAITCKMLVSTTANASNWRGNTFYVGAGAAGGLTNAPYSAAAQAECGSIGTASKNSGGFNVFAPQAAIRTSLSYSSTVNDYFRFGSFILENDTQYDGIQLLPNSGTITGGTIRVYGYTK